MPAINPSTKQYKKKPYPSLFAKKYCDTDAEAVNRIIKAHVDDATRGSRFITMNSGPFIIPPPIPSIADVKPASTATTGNIYIAAPPHWTSVSKNTYSVHDWRLCCVCFSFHAVNKRNR